MLKAKAKVKIIKTKEKARVKIITKKEKAKEKKIRIKTKAAFSFVSSLKARVFLFP